MLLGMLLEANAAQKKYIVSECFILLTLVPHPEIYLPSRLL